MSGYVYLIGTSVYGWYKIGKSKTPEVRISNLGILLPFKIKVYRVWRAEDHDAMEKALHEMYTQNRINGEWFQFTRQQLISMIDKIPAEVVLKDEERLDKFSNINEDVRQSETGKYSGRVLGVRVQKLRGDFTAEEREQRRRTNMALKAEKKKQKQLASVNT